MIEDAADADHLGVRGAAGPERRGDKRLRATSAAHGRIVRACRQQDRKVSHTGDAADAKWSMLRSVMRVFEAEETPPLVRRFVYIESTGLWSAGRTKRESSDDEVIEIEPIATLATHWRVQGAHSHSLCTR